MAVVSAASHVRPFNGVVVAPLQGMDAFSLKWVIDLFLVCVLSLYIYIYI